MTRLSTALKSAGPAVLVRVEEAKGSTPREAGTVMAVCRDTLLGTIGGGQFEWLAIDHARALLAGKRSDWRLEIPLGSDIGQCCGGYVVLAFERVTDAVVAALEAEESAAELRRPQVHIFGAGHVGRALAVALRPLPVRVTVYDGRASELDLLPLDVDRRETALPEADVRAAPPGSAFVVLTHDHALDFMITREALMRRDAAYVGLIGSKTKKETFRRWFFGQGGAAETFAPVVCPIGAGPAKDKHPEVIAALTAAEVVAAFQNHRVTRGENHERSSAAP